LFGDLIRECHVHPAGGDVGRRTAASDGPLLPAQQGER
jgi:hypothetical protein